MISIHSVAYMLNPLKSLFFEAIAKADDITHLSYLS